MSSRQLLSPHTSRKHHSLRHEQFRGKCRIESDVHALLLPMHNGWQVKSLQSLQIKTISAWRLIKLVLG